ncbi:MAG: hypothetical protein EPN43_04005 [Jatrophihabitans sp.]|nr:MAG: hypothetical protein EPN43_04005 [Jatrophihabitans sp.]
MSAPAAAPRATPADPPSTPSRAGSRAEPPLETSPVVLGGVCAGIAPLPFLVVYAVLFIAHALHPVGPPDITATRTGELVAGVVAAVAFVLLAWSVLAYLNHARRWPFLILQFAALVTAVVFLGNSTTGGPVVSAVLAVAAAIAIVLAVLPASAIHVGSPVGRGRRARRLPH